LKVLTNHLFARNFCYPSPRTTGKTSHDTLQYVQRTVTEEKG